MNMRKARKKGTISGRGGFRNRYAYCSIGIFYAYCLF